MTEWDIRKLRILRTLGERGTVTATAEALLMTPSAVSQQLANLAKQLGVPLLEAHGRRVRLTDAAHLVLRHAEAVFAQLERAEAELTGYLHGEVGEVRLAAFSTAVPALVVPAVQRLRSDHPALEVRVREAEAAEAYDLLLAGEVDVALSLAAHAPTARDPKFSRVPLLADPLDVALPAGHPLATAPALRLADLSGEPWIFGGSGPWSRSRSRRARPRASSPNRRTRPRAGRRSSRWSRRGWASRWSHGWRRRSGTRGRAWCCGHPPPTSRGGTSWRRCAAERRRGGAPGGCWTR